MTYWRSSCPKVFYEKGVLRNFADFRSSLPEVFYKKGVLRNYAKFTGKHVCQRLFFNKVADLRPATLLKKSLWPKVCNFIKKESLPQVFSCEFCEISRNTFFTEHLRRLLLKFQNFWEHLFGKSSANSCFCIVWVHCVCPVSSQMKLVKTYAKTFSSHVQSRLIYFLWSNFLIQLLPNISCFLIVLKSNL